MGGGRERRVRIREASQPMRSARAIQSVSEGSEGVIICWIAENLEWTCPPHLVRLKVCEKCTSKQLSGVSGQYTVQDFNL